MPHFISLFLPESLSHWRHERRLEPDLVPVDGVDGRPGDAHGAVGVLDGGHVHRLPVDGTLGGGEDPALKTLVLEFMHLS